MADVTVRKRGDQRAEMDPLGCQSTPDLDEAFLGHAQTLQGVPLTGLKSRGNDQKAGNPRALFIGFGSKDAGQHIQEPVEIVSKWLYLLRVKP